MRSIVHVAACLVCACHAARVQTRNFQQMEEKGDAPHLKKLATLLLASSSFESAGTYSQAQMQRRKAKMQAPSVGDRVWAFFHPAQAQAKLLQKQGGATAQRQEEITKAHAQPDIGLTWGLGDEKGRTFVARGGEAAHSQADEEFRQSQKRNPNEGLNWGLGDEKGRKFGDSHVEGSHSQADVEFSRKQQQNPNVGLNWGLGDEKGRKFGDSTVVGSHSQAEVEFYRKQQQNANVGLNWGLGDEKGRTFGGSSDASAPSQADYEFAQKEQNWARR